jgi:SOS-response transcriptional repressor LexA
VEFGETCRRLRTAQGLSQIEVAERLSAMGTPATNKSISKWEQGASQPSIPQFLNICRIYGVRDPYSVFVENRGEFNALGWQRIAEYMEFLRKDSRFIEPIVQQSGQPATLKFMPAPQPARTIKLYDIPASAGTGVFIDVADYEEIEVDDCVPICTDFALRISGNSMEPTFENGQIVYVRKQESLEVGEVGIFVLNGEVFCKELGRGRLISRNSKYKPIILSEYDELYIFGKVVE